MRSIKEKNSSTVEAHYKDSQFLTLDWILEAFKFPYFDKYFSPLKIYYSVHLTFLFFRFSVEIRNDDGIWLRLTAETIKDHCNIFYQEAWCLGYNQHLGKTLLLPIEGPKLTVNRVVEEKKFRKENDK